MEMATQLAVIMVGKQMVNNTMEVGLPLVPQHIPFSLNPLHAPPPCHPLCHPHCHPSPIVTPPPLSPLPHCHPSPIVTPPPLSALPHCHPSPIVTPPPLSALPHCHPPHCHSSPIVTSIVTPIAIPHCHPPFSPPIVTPIVIPHCHPLLASPLSPPIVTYSSRNQCRERKFSRQKFCREKFGRISKSRNFVVGNFVLIRINTAFTFDYSIIKLLLLPMLSTPCESVQICTDPDRYSRIVRKLKSHKFNFRKRN